MKLLLLSDPNSVHTIKWATSLAKQGIQVKILGLRQLTVNDYFEFSNIDVVTISDNQSKSGVSSILALLKAPQLLKQTIAEFKPDLLHSHYASSYGLFGAISKFHPFIISLWGSDVFEFPNQSFLKKLILKFNLSKADKILSTSKIMAVEGQKYTTKPIDITPFGIDPTKFTPQKVNSIFKPNDIVIGTTKNLEHIYGVDLLIEAFHIVKTKYSNLPLKLLLVGSGSQRELLERKILKLNLQGSVIFTGKVTHSDVAKYINMMTIFVANSRAESFGVSVVEASSCEKPVIVANVGGLPEVVVDNRTGLMVEAENAKQTANAIEKLILNPELIKTYGIAGREFALKNYNWQDNVHQMIGIYKKEIT